MLSQSCNKRLEERKKTLAITINKYKQIMIPGCISKGGNYKTVIFRIKVFNTKELYVTLRIVCEQKKTTRDGDRYF